MGGFTKTFSKGSAPLGAKVNPFTPLIEDGHTVAYFDDTDLSLITKDVNNFVSAEASKIGTVSVLQATGAKQPLSTVNGIEYDGVDDMMKVILTLPQPISVYMVINQKSWKEFAGIFDGGTNASCLLYHVVTTGNGIGLRTGGVTLWLSNDYNIIGRSVILRFVLNGATSKIQIEKLTAAIGNAGTGVPNGITFGSNDQSAGFANFKIKACIVRDVVDTDENSDIIYNELFRKYFSTYKRVTIIGDSISRYSVQGFMWPNILIKEDKYLLNVKSVSGTGVIDGYADQVAASATDNANIIIIAMGTNDDNAGNMTTLANTFSAGIAALKASNPNANIYVMGVLPRWTDNGGGTVVDKSNIRTAISASCTANGVTYWDTFTTPWIDAADTSDGLHPIEAGSVKINTKMVALLP